MPAKPSSDKQTTHEPKSDVAVSYNEFKEYEGQRYTGMKIGRSHKWYYDQGEWKETKITPDLWQIGYAVTKRRAGRAPEGSGVPVGTEYHWYVLAHQNVAKQNANDYTTSLTGLKFKIAHKRAGSDKWSATPKTQRKRMIQFLQGVIADLEKQNEREVSERISGRPEIGTARPIEPVAARRRSAKPAPASSERPASRRPPVQRRPAASHVHRTSRAVAAGA
jgi:hypothetical protein